MLAKPGKHSQAFATNQQGSARAEGFNTKEHISICSLRFSRTLVSTNSQAKWPGSQGWKLMQIYLDCFVFHHQAVRGRSRGSAMNLPSIYHARCQLPRPPRDAMMPKAKSTWRRWLGSKTQGQKTGTLP